MVILGLTSWVTAWEGAFYLGKRTRCTIVSALLSAFERFRVSLRVLEGRFWVLLSTVLQQIWLYRIAGVA